MRPFVEWIAVREREKLEAPYGDPWAYRPRAANIHHHLDQTTHTEALAVIQIDVEADN